jgi:hypothetical protein
MRCSANIRNLTAYAGEELGEETHQSDNKSNNFKDIDQSHDGKSGDCER